MQMKLCVMLHDICVCFYVSLYLTSTRIQGVGCSWDKPTENSFFGLNIFFARNYITPHEDMTEVAYIFIIRCLKAKGH